MSDFPSLSSSTSTTPTSLDVIRNFGAMRLRDDDVALPSLRGDDDELRDDELPDVVA